MDSDEYISEDSDMNFEISDEEHDDFFDPIIPASQVKKVYQVDYRCVSTKEIEEIQLSEANHVSNILGIPLDACKLLLKLFKWDKEVMVEEFVDTKIKFSFENSIKEAETSCDICCDSGLLKVFSACCGHQFCTDCYAHYVGQKIKEGEVLIKCAAECDVLIGWDKVPELIDADMVQKYISN
jgi:ariadne-1